MLVVIFLLLYFRFSTFLVHSCLSNQQGGCSVASYRFNPDCREELGHKTHGGPPTEYQGFLGAGVQAKAYSEKRGSSDFAKYDSDLHCLSALNCTWQNVDDDFLDWVVGEGSVDPLKLALITGSQQLPGNLDRTFLILASDPRIADQDGQLVSVAIGCQQSTGILSFRYWRSRARTVGSEPKLDICTRKVLEANLENCMTVTPTANHTIIASVPPILEPFVIVLRGYNFENEPEGGLILLDEIEYFAHVDQPENCASKPVENSEIEPLKSETTADGTRQVISGDSGDADESQLVSHEVAFSSPTSHERPQLTNESAAHLVLLNSDAEYDTCKSLQCLVGDLDAPCDYKRAGFGSKGEGYYVGWRITSIRQNIANKLTGVHVSPKPDERTNFLVANFVGFRPERTLDRYVLEAPEFSISETPTAYLSFKKYIATQGLFLSVCEDGEATRCFWNVYEHSAEPFARKWTKEVVLLPGELPTFFIVAWQNTTAKPNYGQIGLTEIALYTDSQANNPLC